MNPSCRNGPIMAFFSESYSIIQIFLSRMAASAQHIYTKDIMELLP